jgi:uncharacterized protein (TIGR03086 family)
MSEDMLAVFDRAAALADTTVAAVRPEQLGDPTPCTQWTVRLLLNHLVGGNLAFLSMGEGTPPPDRSADHLGDDYLASFRATVDKLKAMFGRPGFLEQPANTPFGPGTGATLLQMRFNEFMIHSWDLARATGQSTDLDRELAERSLAMMQAALGQRPRDENLPFGPEQSAPDGAPAADRLAAFVGRVV